MEKYGRIALQRYFHIQHILRVILRLSAPLTYFMPYLALAHSSPFYLIEKSILIVTEAVFFLLEVLKAPPQL